MFFAQSGRFGGRPFLWTKGAAGWRSLSYADVAVEVRRVARGLLALGVGPGDRVALVAENRPEWPIADLAIMSIGAITVPAFTTNTTTDHRHVLSHSGARGVIVSSRAIAERLLPAAVEAPDLSFVVTIEHLPIAQRIAQRIVTWDDMLTGCAGQAD